MSRKSKNAIGGPPLQGSPNEGPTPSSGLLAALFRPHNRGLLLDIVVFAFNLLLVRLLMVRFVAMLRSAEDGDVTSEWVLFLFILGIFFLPPIGATLKRWQYYLRRGDQKGLFDNDLAGCLFGPIPYFIVTVLIFVVIQTFLLEYFYGNSNDDGTAMVVGTLLNLPVSIINTWLVFRFFSKPKKEPIFRFLETPLSSLIGDICIFVNMIFYQLIWNLLSGWFPRPADATEFFARGILLLILSLLIYFPPRMFYLADDIDKRRTWLMILLANLPIIIRVMIGTARDGITGW
jgi:hypothetical protein